MVTSTPCVITISRQLGSGGAYIGQQLSKRLNILYFDREIISKAAEELYISDEDLEALDEKPISSMSSSMNFLFQLYSLRPGNAYLPPKILPTDRELYKTESKIIEQIYQKYPSVIIGRCGSYILRGKPNHISIFLHANIDFRTKRIQELYSLSIDEAEKMIKKSDIQRHDYYMKVIGEEWKDFSKYDITFDTSKIQLDNCVDLIVKYIEYGSNRAGK